MGEFALEPTTTYPEMAWVINAVPVTLTLAALLLVVFLLRDQITRLLIAANVRRAARRREALPSQLVPDAALYWNPETVAPARFLLIGVVVAVIVLLVLSFVASLFVALVLTGPLTAALIWAFVMAEEQRYTASLDRDLTATVGRLGALLRGGTSYRQSLERVLRDMPDGPLASEWRYLLERQGVPLEGTDGIATAAQVVAALAIQTPSRRHATFLNHLAVTVNQPQDVLTARVESAYTAMQASDRRREEAVTELAQMRYSGMAVGLAGLVMALYLVWTQWERVVIAYSTTLGAIVGVIVVASLFLPIVGGALLARAEDIDY